jgi:drug/metabolite transporter (DMT)-like permease
MLGDYVWLFYALYAALAYGITRLLYRSFMRHYSAYALAICLSFFGFLWALPLWIANPVVPTTWFPWVLVLASGVTWAIVDVISNLSFKYTPVSVREPIIQTELVWAFILALVILHERATTLKVVGVLCIFSGMLLVTLHPKFIKASFASYGVRMTLLVALLSAIAAIIDKAATNYFTAEAFNPIGYLAPGLILLLFIRKRKAETKKLLKFQWKKLVLAGFLSASMYYSILKAYTLADSSQVYPFIHLGSVIVIVGGMLVFREERVHVLRKCIAGALILFGALCITGSVFW